MQRKHDEQRLFLIRELLAEEPEYKNIHIPEDKKGQEDLLRSLMNVRMPRPVSENFLKVQDEYLQKDRDLRGVVDSEKLAPIGADERIAVETVKSFLDEKMSPIQVIFNVFKDVDLQIYENLLMP